MFRLSADAIDAFEEAKALVDPGAGAMASFEGWVRNHHEGRAVLRLEYEAYADLAGLEGNRILTEAIQKFDLTHARCVHRTGNLAVGELAVWVGVSAFHRDEAFQACRFIIDEIKVRLPIWKKEYFADGTVAWVNCQRCEQHARLPVIREESFYSRQTILKEVGEVGQQKLKEASVLVVGAGGLGSPALLYLAAAGVGTLGICEFDTLHESNLHRQVLYHHGDIGQPKAVLAARQLQALNPAVRICRHDVRLAADNIEAVMAPYDWILDCTDNFSARFLINDAAVLLKKPLIQASIYQYEGQLQLITPGSGCLRCQWPEIPAEGCVGNCAEVGVLGVVPGVFGTLQAAETLKLILGLPTPLTDQILLMDLLNNTVRKIVRPRRTDCAACHGQVHLTDLHHAEEMEEEKVSLHVSALNPVAYHWIDVRERFEVDRHPAPWPSETFPMSTFDSARLKLDQSYLLFCQTGKRSLALARSLRAQGYAHVYSLAGGIAASQTQGVLAR